jgi:hypothetical protein
MKKFLLTTILFLAGCATLTPTQGAIIMTANSIASAALSAVASAYGGPAAGELAAAGLSAEASVLQGYVNSKIPSQVVTAAPGVAGLDNVISGIVSSSKTVKQSDVTVLNDAAQILTAAVPIVTGTSNGVGG